MTQGSGEGGAGRICPSCGAVAPPHARYCQNCGGRVDAAGTRRGPSVWRVLAAIGLILLIMPLGAFGACALIVGLLGNIDGGTNGGTLGLAALGGAALLLAALAGYAVYRLLRG